MNLKIVDFLLNDRELWGAFGPPKGLLHRSRGKADTKPSAPERPSRRGRHWTIPSALTLCRSWAGPGKLHSLGEPPGGSQTEPPPLMEEGSCLPWVCWVRVPKGQGVRSLSVALLPSPPVAALGLHWARKPHGDGLCAGLMGPVLLTLSAPLQRSQWALLGEM